MRWVPAARSIPVHLPQKIVLEPCPPFSPSSRDGCCSRLVELQRQQPPQQQEQLEAAAAAGCIIQQEQEREVPVPIATLQPGCSGVAKSGERLGVAFCSGEDPPSALGLCVCEPLSLLPATAHWGSG